MKRLVLPLCCLAPLIGLAAQYSIGWHKIVSGGGASTGGTYQVHGSIGQPDAGAVLSGGQYAVMGGFWSLAYVVQTPGAPVLTLSHVGNQTIVSWPSSASGWTLQTNNDLSSSNWGNYVGPIINNSVTTSLPKGNLFFRLQH
jgi:hypothetical protein